MLSIEVAAVKRQARLITQAASFSFMKSETSSANSSHDKLKGQAKTNSDSNKITSIRKMLFPITHNIYGN